jgi:hypothetical protein
MLLLLVNKFNDRAIFEDTRDCREAPPLSVRVCFHATMVVDGRSANERRNLAVKA